jgi:cytochrome c-type biogenesis protein CcmH
MKRYYWIALLVILVTALSASSAAAQQPTPSDDEVNAIAKQMFCPVCENTPLDVCPTQACAQWRELIREKLAAGWSEKQIKDYFVEQYGARVLGAPPARGLNWLVYLIPPIAILVGIYILYRAMHSWKQSPEDINLTTSPADEPQDEYVARLEEELRKR